jgi:DNA-binding CsgD family transcriptional regulator
MDTGEAFMLAGLSKGQDLLRRVAADPTADVAVGLVGPGGSGKSAVLAAVRAAYEDAGIRVVNQETLAELTLATDVAVIVDDTHELSATLLNRLEELVGTAGIRLFVAFRPWPQHAELTRVVAALRRVRPLVVLEHLDRTAIEERASAVLHQPPSSTLLNRLTEQTGGHLMLLDVMLDAVQINRRSKHRNELHIASQVVDQVRHLIDSIDTTVRALLLLLALGARLEHHLVSRVLGLTADSASDIVEQVRATGFMRSDGTLIPLIREALLSATSAERIREVQIACFDVEYERGGDVVEFARSLARGGIRDVRVAKVVEQVGDLQLIADPESASALYNEAVAAGASPARLALRRARAAAMNGRLDEASQLAEQVLREVASPDIAQAIDVSATVLAHRGLLDRASELYQWLGPERISTGAASAALALMGTGDRDAAEQMLKVASTEQLPTMLAGAQSLMAQGVWDSISGSATSAVSTLSRATTLLEPAGRTALLPDTPAALAALVAIHTGELDIADSALRRAISQDLGGPPAHARHHLLLAWVAMLRGVFTVARDLIERAQELGPGVQPRDELFVHALDVGLARRTSDVPALVRTWSAAREAIVRHPIDLFTLLPLGEFTVAAARLRDSARLSPYLDDAWRLLRRLGDPVLWGTPLHWYGVHAAILSGRHTDLEPHARALVRAAHSSHFAAVLAEAGRVWVNVLASDIDVDAVQAAARALQSVGLAWDGSRLLGQAAARTTDRKMMAALLQAARAMQEPQGPAVSAAPEAASTPAATTPAAFLSGREREVAELLLQNRTYREIGGALFISPKTVEHHVARMKQRLGAGGRSELFAQLRVIMSSGVGHSDN